MTILRVPHATGSLLGIYSREEVLNVPPVKYSNSDPLFCSEFHFIIEEGNIKITAETYLQTNLIL